MAKETFKLVELNNKSRKGIYIYIKEKGNGKQKMITIPKKLCTILNISKGDHLTIDILKIHKQMPKIRIEK